MIIILGILVVLIALGLKWNELPRREAVGASILALAAPATTYFVSSEYAMIISGIVWIFLIIFVCSRLSL